MFYGRNCQKTATNEEEKCALSPRQCIMSQVDCNDGKTIWIALRIASALILFSRSGSPAITSCLQTSKECSRERDLTPMKKWYQKLICILRPKTNHSTKKKKKKASNCWRSAGISISPKKETMLMNKVEFCRKVVALLVRPRTYWVMCYELVCGTYIIWPKQRKYRLRLVGSWQLVC